MRGKEKGVWKRLDFASQSYRGIMFVSYVLVGGLALILMVAGVFHGSMFISRNRSLQ